MTATTLVRLAGVAGGLCWIAQALLDNGDGPASVIDALHYGGLVLLVIALLGIGAGLVTGLLALRVVVAICLVALAWAVTAFLYNQYSDPAVDGVLGALMVIYCVAGILARRGREDDGEPRSAHRSRGSHAA